MSNVVKFPFSVSRRAHARKPRTSENGTPKERATLREIVVEEIDAMGGIDYLLDYRPPGWIIVHNRREWASSQKAP
jgi:hypothetical protein